MSDLVVHFDARAFTEELGRWAAHSRKDMGKVIEQQARLVLRNIIEVTPPGKQGRQPGEAKAAGERMVKGDLARLFRPVSVTKVSQSAAAEAKANGANMAAIHARHRGRNGRVPKRTGVKYAVPAAAFRKYEREKVRRVGSLAAGWMRSVNKLGLKRVPAWVQKHNSPGDIQVVATDRVLMIRMKNAVRYAGDFAGMERRIQWALNLQANKMRRQVDDLLAKRKRL